MTVRRRDVLGAEVLKLRTVRLPVGIAAVLLALAAAIGTVMARAAESTTTLADVARGPAKAAWFFAVVVAVVASAGEFQHRTVRTTLLASPSRPTVLLAKSAAAAAYGAALTGAASVVALLAAAATATLSGEHVAAGSVLPAVAGVVLLGALWGVVATGLGILARNVTVAVVAVLLWTFVLEGVVPVVLHAPWMVRWLPSSAADAVVGLGGHSLSPAAGAALFAAYAGTLAAAAAAAFLRRDPA